MQDQRRSHWPVRVKRLGEPDAAGETSAEERLAMMWELVTQAWAVAGRPLPDYTRAETPVRVLRRGETGDS